MLQTQTVDRTTLELLKDLLADPLKKMTWKQVKTKMQRATETYLKRNRI
jgi:hypothetical protein